MDAFEVLQQFFFSTLRSAFAPMRWIKSSRRSTRVSVSSRLRCWQTPPRGSVAAARDGDAVRKALPRRHGRGRPAPLSVRRWQRGRGATQRADRSSLTISRKRFSGSTSGIGTELVEQARPPGGGLVVIGSGIMWLTAFGGQQGLQDRPGWVTDGTRRPHTRCSKACRADRVGGRGVTCRGLNP